MSDNVIHPAHYNMPGRKECIEEMKEVFGWEKTEAFCELNSYKYQYRHEQKNGQEDLEKSKNYEKMRSEMIMNDPRFKIADHYGEDVQLQQLVEEMAELTKAISKHWRMEGKGQPVAPGTSRKDIEDNLVEEIADVKLVLDEVIFLMAIDEEIKDVIDFKVKRSLERMGEE